jgi:hypothetical protein
MGDPLVYLAEVLSAIAESPRVSPGARDWLFQGVRDAADEGLPLEKALELTGYGSRTFRYRVALLQRDELLLEALRSVSLDPAVDDWQLCRRLAPMIERLMAFETRNIGKSPSPPDHWPSCKRLVYRAAAIAIEFNLSMPCTAKGVLAAVKRVAAYSDLLDGQRLSELILYPDSSSPCLSHLNSASSSMD